MNRAHTVKLIFIDVETTGITCPESGLIQLAGTVEVDGNYQEDFEYRIRPFPRDEISDEALAVNGLSRAEILDYSAPEEVYPTFVELLSRYVDRYDRSDKFHFVAYNARFDADHIRAWFEKNGDKFYGSWFFHPPIDVMGIAAVHLMSRRATMKDFKLATVAAELGLEVDDGKMHDARYDVGLTREMFNCFKK